MRAVAGPEDLPHAQQLSCQASESVHFHDWQGTSWSLCCEEIFVAASRAFCVKRKARTASLHCAAICRAHDRKSSRGYFS